MKKIGILFMLIIFTFTACSSNSSNNNPITMPDKSSNNSLNNRTTTIQKDGQKSVEQINMMFTVDEIQEANTTMKKVISENNVSIVSLSIQDDKTRKPMATYYLRVPPNKNNSFYNSIKKLGELTQEVQRGDDATNQYNDVKIRMDSLKKQYDQLNDLLKTTKNMQEILVLEEKISQNIEKQETLKSQMKQLESQTDYISYSITLNQNIERTPTVQQGFVKRVGSALKGTGVLFINFMQMMIIALIYLIPYLIILAILYFAYKIYRKKYPAKPREHRPLPRKPNPYQRNKEKEIKEDPKRDK